MSDFTADCFLAFTHFPLLFFLTIIGTLWWGRGFFLPTVFLIAFDIVVNVALKGTFKIPLAAALHKVGYAFPSGHMQLATVFYCWLASLTVSWLGRGVIMMLLIGIGASLIHFGYHNLYEVLGGLVSGILLMVVFRWLLTYYRHSFFKTLFWAASLLMMYSGLMYQAIPRHACAAYVAIGLLFLMQRMTVVYRVRHAIDTSVGDGGQSGST
ncbi:phosphatase PAP2 family protein [Legionella oakridgensis]|uniref:PAP2 superfamily n=2 Tax=Legionella oakridgensis TaxID=29423 RepID=W0B7T3_9GAMM|nr:phosphatase PAP2 family protein [Legionella oakridgensis]AHE65915.1 PAP2 superfamily [Legionella oakridgensis ATCC 33761 = DSM 21215]KTD43769.1 PAP2 superfamily protein [Legionella oakridgensis]STY15846.1 PAP2 superfamily [Legionella longbeachae]